MATIVLVHGAWHGAWCWERVVPLLEAKGHRVVAPDLPGMGADRTPLREVSLESWADFVAELIDAEPDPVVLVGHSRGGVVISQAAEYAPEQVEKLVYLSAFLVRNGESLWETLQELPGDPERGGDLKISPDQSTTSLLPEAVRTNFYNTTDEQWAARAASLICPEPMASFVTPLALTDDAFGSIPRVYIECKRDRAIPLSLQRLMVAQMPCEQVFSLDTDHSPFYSNPEALAAILDDIANGESPSESLD